MRYILLEWAPFVLHMKQPKRENTLETIKQGWKDRKIRNEDDRTAFTYVRFCLKFLETFLKLEGDTQKHQSVILSIN